jgi:hypothetical protein
MSFKNILYGKKIFQIDEFKAQHRKREKKKFYFINP